VVATEHLPQRLLEKEAMTVPPVSNINKNMGLRRMLPPASIPSDHLRKFGRHRLAGRATPS
jgi:hypothetical protein